MKITPELLAELAQEVESEDPIDWAMLPIDESTAYIMMATNVLEAYDDADQIALLATITKLVVENFTLHLKIEQRRLDDN